jgi:hypothetical protein
MAKKASKKKTEPTGISQAPATTLSQESTLRASECLLESGDFELKVAAIIHRDQQVQKILDARGKRVDPGKEARRAEFKSRKRAVASMLKTIAHNKGGLKLTKVWSLRDWWLGTQMHDVPSDMSDEFFFDGLVMVFDNVLSMALRNRAGKITVTVASVWDAHLERLNNKYSTLIYPIESAGDGAFAPVQMQDIAFIQDEIDTSISWEDGYDDDSDDFDEDDAGDRRVSNSFEEYPGENLIERQNA